MLAFNPHVVFWDESVYIGMGKYLYSDGTIGLWEDLRPMFLPLMLGPLWLVGAGLFSMEILMLLISAAYVLLTYLLAKELFNDEIAAWAGIIVLVTPVFFKNTGLFLTDIASAMFAGAAVLLFTKKKFMVAGILAGIAFLTRFPHGLIIPILGALTIIQEKDWKITARYIAGTTIVLIPFFIFNYITYHNVATFVDALLHPIIMASAHQSNPFAPTGSLFFYGRELIENNITFVFTIAAFAVVLLQKKYKENKTQILLTIAVLYFAYFTLISNKQPRFALSFIPFIAIIAAYGIFELFKKDNLKVLCIGIAMIAFLSAYSQDSTYSFWRETADTTIVDQFYTYDYNGTVLTSDPVPAAYNDLLFIPYYFSVHEGLPIVKETLQKYTAKTIIYSPRSLPCTETDEICKKERDEIVKLIKKNKLIFNATYYEENYYIYEVE